MRIDGNTSLDMLMHSDNLAYIDLDEGELMHWKYVKKERVNGKWRYYYDVGMKTNADGSVSTSDIKTRKYFNNKKEANKYEKMLTDTDEMINRAKKRSADAAAERKKEQAQKEAAKKEAEKKVVKGKNFVLRMLYKWGLYKP